MANYERALNYFLEKNWDELRQELHIPQDWWDTISEGICKTDEFNEVIEKRRDAARVFEELYTQLTTFPDQAPIPAPYTGAEASDALQDIRLSSWEIMATVTLHYPTTDGEVNWEKTYCWSLYQIDWLASDSDEAPYAFALDPPFKTAMHLLERKKTRELLDAFEIRQSWNEGGQLAQKFYDEGFHKVLEYMADKAVRSQHMYTQFSDVFSLIRGKEAVEDNRKDQTTVASIILDCKEGSDGRLRVRVWRLKVSREHYVSEGRALEDCNSAVEQGELVYKAARKFYVEQNWAGLRNLFDIDRDWWDGVLKKLCQSRLFGKILEQLQFKESCNEIIFPQFNNIFSWTRVPGCKPEDVKVIIVGQDPVPDPRATGISFLIEGEVQDCPSINNVFDAVKSNLGGSNREATITHKCPYSWCTQGVLLLNTYMTIGRDQGHRHNKIGWQRMTNRILEYFVDNAVDRKLHILLWHAYWNNGTPTHKERLNERAIGDNVELFHTDHPTADYGVKFRRDAPGVFESVDTIRWETITDGYPTIPPGVIHPHLPTDLQMADLNPGLPNCQIV